MNLRTPAPFPYQGSKRKLAPRILGFLPQNLDCLYEPFAGAAAVSIAGAHASRAISFRLSDVNGELVELWTEIINHPRRLATEYEHLWHAQQGRQREYYDRIRDQFNASGGPARFLYLLARCVKASVRYNARGEFNQSPDNRRLGMHPEKMRRQLESVSALLANRCVVSAQDYRSALVDVQPQDVIYMDPPYQGVSSNRDARYVAGLSFDEFVTTIGSMVEDDLSFLISYDGRTGNRSFGNPLPPEFGLTHVEIHAGRSTQSTLLGRSEDTVESLYLSPALVRRLKPSALPSAEGRTQKRLQFT